MNYIKVSKLEGRAGHQLAEWNAALYISAYFGIKFIHTPLNFGWEEALEFGKNELTEPPEYKKVNKVIKLPKFDSPNIEEIRPTIESQDNVLFLLSNRQNLRNHWLTEDILKSKWIMSPINKPFKNDEHKIGVHIRRGDVTQAKHPDRWVDNSVYVDIIDEVLATNKNAKIHIFTEGNVNQFKEFEKYKPTFHINGSEFEAFNKMTKCETLITGKSGFSYFASILSTNNIIPIPFWHEYPEQKRITKI